MNRTLLISLGIVATAAVATWKGCKYDWNPHYASNKDVHMHSHPLNNSDSSVAVVGYTLDVGARGDREYTTLLRKENYQGDLAEFMLPAEYTEPVWRGKDTLEAIYDEEQAFMRGGNVTNVDKERDIVKLNRIVIKVKQRRLNRQEAINKFMKSNGF
jgi:hypothetical protein